uniref:BTB domain-containing protein n=1 Tax=Glossina palpalis gambiensis TaxID=67801 RepID=A0A1B0B9T0_9MUSC
MQRFKCFESQSFIFLIPIADLSNRTAANYINDGESFAEKKYENHYYCNSFVDSLKKMTANQKTVCDRNSSDYFAVTFGTDMKEKQERVFKLQNMDVIAVKALVNYVYSGVNALTEDNVEKVMSLTNILRSCG